MLQFKQSAFRTSSNEGSSAVDAISEVTVQQTPLSKRCSSAEEASQGTDEISGSHSDLCTDRKVSADVNPEKTENILTFRHENGAQNPCIIIRS
jgi:hypothetical protein